MSKLNSQKAIRLLKKEKGNYLKQCFSGGLIYNSDGDDIGDVSQKVIDNLLSKGKIKKAANCEESWSDGYYRLAV